MLKNSFVKLACITPVVEVGLPLVNAKEIVRLLKEAGNVVGYMGDGINDSPSLVNSEVGISVDTAVDIAKETAERRYGRYFRADCRSTR